jgi:hypothetical protein
MVQSTTHPPEDPRRPETAAQAAAAQAAAAAQTASSPPPEGRAGEGPPLGPAQLGMTGTGGPGPGGFQKTVTTQPAPALPGDFCDANPRSSFDAGPGGLVAGTNGVTIGAFAWLDTTGPLDANGVHTRVLNSGAGAPTGFVHREQQGLITLYLAYAGMLIPAGFGVTLMTSGGYWVLNTGAAASVLGQKAFASLTTGAVQVAAAGATVAGYVETKYWVMSVGAVGELIKISSWPLG